MKYRSAFMRAIYGTSFVLFSLGLILFFLVQDFNIWSGGSGPWSVTGYSDADRGGESRILEFDENLEMIRASFTIPQENAARYAGMGFFPVGSGPRWMRDFSHFDYLELKYRTVGDSRFCFLVMADLPGYTRDGDANSRRYMTAEIAPSADIRRAVFKLDRFVTPGWWVDQHPAWPVDPAVPDFSRVINLDISVSSRAGTDRPHTIEIVSLRFRQSRLLAFLLLALSTVPVLASLFGMQLARLARRSRCLAEYRREGNSEKGAGYRDALELPSWNRLEVTSRDDEDFARLSALIARSYTDPALSVQGLASVLGLPVERISRVLEAKTGLRFNRYVNIIRIGEASRLLKHCDKTAAEIAYLVGYASLGHFNRVFKDLTRMTPTAFRKSGTLPEDLPDRALEAEREEALAK